MIKKENFCRLINTIHQYHDSLDDVREVMPGLQEDIMDLTGDLLSEIVVFLDDELNLPIMEHIGSTISWWLWECDFGKNHPDVTMKDRDTGKETTFHLDTVEKLYDYLIKYEVNFEVHND